MYCRLRKVPAGIRSAIPTALSCFNIDDDDAVLLDFGSDASVCCPRRRLDTSAAW